MKDISDESIRAVVALQEQLRSQVRATPSLDIEQVRTVAGVDASYRERPRAAVAIMSMPELRVVAQATATAPDAFPYIPGLLSFREAPVALAALRQLAALPDVLLCDGQGYAHPRRFGLACHIGVVLDMPTIGCAKSRLIGTYEEPGPESGDHSPLIDAGEVIGAVLRTQPRTKPIFVSIGHQIDLPTAVALVMRCVTRYRLPEPIRAADHLANVTP